MHIIGDLFLLSRVHDAARGAIIWDDRHDYKKKNIIKEEKKNAPCVGYCGRWKIEKVERLGHC